MRRRLSSSGEGVHASSLSGCAISVRGRSSSSSVPAGAVGVEGDEICEQPVYPVAAIDTVGAGDAFVAGYLSLWNDDVPLHRRLERATAAGAFACTVVGDWEGVPTMAELNRLSDPEGIAR